MWRFEIEQNYSVLFNDQLFGLLEELGARYTIILQPAIPPSFPFELYPAQHSHVGRIAVHSSKTIGVETAHSAKSDQGAE